MSSMHLLMNRINYIVWSLHCRGRRAKANRVLAAWDNWAARKASLSAVVTG